MTYGDFKKQGTAVIPLGNGRWQVMTRDLSGGAPVTLTPQGTLQCLSPPRQECPRPSCKHTAAVEAYLEEKRK